MQLEEESGSSDNRLSWNPNEFKDTADWENGQEYTITARIKQTAPGEATILEMSGEVSEPSPENPPSAQNGNEAAPSDDEGGYSNPAIGRAMSRRKY